MAFIVTGGDQPPEEQLCRELLELAALVRYVFPRGETEDLEPHVLQVLMALRLSPNQRAGELADQLTLDRSTVSHALRQLRDEGLISDDRDPRDARRRLHRPTRRGTWLVKRFLASVEQAPPPKRRTQG